LPAQPVQAGADIASSQLKPKNGYIDLPAAPGYMDVDAEALRKVAAKPYTLRRPRHAADEGS
jgi:hypothetical protein